MDSDDVPARDHLVLKVAAGVVLGGVVLYGLARVAGLPFVTPQTSAYVPPAVVLPPAAETPSDSRTAAPVTSMPPPAVSKAAAPPSIVQAPSAPASAAPATASPSTPGSEASPSSAVSPSDDAAAANAPRKLEPVPEGYRCIEGRLFRVLPNGFEQLTDGSEKRYCP